MGGGVRGGGGGVAVEIGEPAIGRRRELYSGWGFEMGGLESSNRLSCLKSPNT